jgi:phage-related minor tail protein
MTGDHRELEQHAVIDAKARVEDIKDLYEDLDKVMGRDDPFGKADMKNKAIMQRLSDYGAKFGALPEGMLERAREAMAENIRLAAKDVMGPAREIKSIAEQMADGFESSFDRMTDSLLDFNKSGKEIITDFVTDFLKQWAKLEMKQAMSQGIGEASNWIKGMIPMIQNMFASENGSAFNNGIRFMAKGGLLNGPTYLGRTADGTHQVGGEAGPEAVMPLQRGSDGKLGLAATPVTINVINNASGTKATAKEETDSKGERKITVMVEEVVESALGSGKFDKVLGHNFGVNRKGK